MTHLTRLLTIGCALLLVQAAAGRAGGQERPPARRVGTGLVAGRVLDSTSGSPIAGAIVTLTAGALVERVGTDSNGRFAFAGVPGPAVSLGAEKLGYIAGGYGSRRPLGVIRRLPISEGGRIVDLTIRLWRSVAVQGRVTDEAGEPVVGVLVQSLKRGFIAGHPRLTAAGSALTDDRGIYRIASLVPGEYVVAVGSTQTTVAADVLDAYWQTPPNATLRSALTSAAGVPPRVGDPGHRRIGDVVLVNLQQSPVSPDLAPDGTLMVYPTSYNPGVLAAQQAAAVVLAAGDIREGVDVALPATKATRITGTLAAPNGPAAFQRVQLFLQGSEEVWTPSSFESARTITDGRGAFTMLGVPAGQYVLRATRAPRPAARGIGPTPGGTEPTLWLDESVTVGPDGATISASLRPGVRVSGRFEFLGGIAPETEQLSRVPIVLEAADGRPIVTTPPAQVDPSGVFTTHGVASGRYIIRIGGPPAGWTLRAVMVEGRDVAETPVELKSADLTNVVILFTNRVTELSGIARDARREPDADATVLIFPADRLGWIDFGTNPARLRSVRVDPDGTFRAANLPAGDYFVTAIDDEAAVNWQQIKMLDALSRRATRIRLDEGERKTLELVTVR